MQSIGWVGVQGLVSTRLGGVALILAGLALGALGMPSGNDSSAPQSALRAEAGDGASVDQVPVRGSAFGHLAALLPTASPHARAAEPVVVTIAQRPSEAPATPPRAAPIPRDRDALARELQKELRRVGCYEGELNGAWTPSTRRAMKAFTDRVNATLPVDEPDAVLFAMVQGQQDRVCDKPCPAGQAISEDGRCLPSAILAKAAKKVHAPTATAQLPPNPPTRAPNRGQASARWTATVTAAAPAPLPAAAGPPAIASVPIEGRMGLAGPTEPPRSIADSPDPTIAKPHVRSRAAARARRPRGPHFVSGPRRRSFVGSFMRGFLSSL